MSRTGQITLFFGEAEFDFRLRIGEAMELQDVTDCGLMETLNRVAGLAVKDIAAVLRLGLIGGGMDKAAAAKLVARHVVDGYFGEAAAVASEVIRAAVRGVEDEPLGEADGGEATAQAADPLSPAARSGTASSSASGSAAEA